MNAAENATELMNWRTVTCIVACNSVAILFVAAVLGILYCFNQRWIGLQWTSVAAGVAVGQLSVVTFVIVILEPHHPKRWLAISGIALFAAFFWLVIALGDSPVKLNTLNSREDVVWYALSFLDTFVCVFATVIAYFLSMTVLWWPVRCFWSYKFYISEDKKRMSTSRLTVSGILLWTTAIASLIALTSNQPNIAYATGALVGIQCLAIPMIAAACWAAFHTVCSRWGPLCIACVAIVALEILVLSFSVNQLLGFSWLAIVFNVTLALVVFGNLVWLKNAGMHIAKDKRESRTETCS